MDGRRDADCGARAQLGDLMHARLYRAKFWAAAVLTVARFLYQLARSR